MKCEPMAYTGAWIGCLLPSSIFLIRRSSFAAIISVSMTVCMPFVWGWSRSSLHPQIRDHLLDQCFGFGNGQVEEGSSSSGINIGSRCHCEPIVEVLQDELLVHAMMRTGQDVFLQPLPSFWDGFHPRLLET